MSGCDFHLRHFVCQGRGEFNAAENHAITETSTEGKKNNQNTADDVESNGDRHD